MTVRSRVFMQPSRSSTPRFELWYPKIAIAGFLGILVYTLFPYDFSLIGNLSPDYISRQLTSDRLSGLKDYLELLLNFLVFALFSFGLVGALRQQGLNKLTTFCVMLVLCGSLGMMAEMFQGILPGRHVNLLDMLTGSIGGLIGWLLFYWLLFYQWPRPCVRLVMALRQTMNRMLTPRCLVLGFVGYFLLATVAVVLLPTATNLRNWDASMPLVLGNEPTGGRSWQGAIAQVQFWEKALSPAQVAQLLAATPAAGIEPAALVASYQFTPPDPYRDRAGQLPRLSWSQAETTSLDPNGVQLRSSWLQTTIPATSLNQQIQQQEQFTLNLIATPANLQQRGPARIVTLSKDSRNRNFTVGQAANDLVIRLRTPITGRNGSNPPIIVPQVFRDTTPRHLVVTYARSTLHVYVDDSSNDFTVKLPHLGYRLLYYGGVLVPLGCLLGLLLSQMRTPMQTRIAFLVGGMMLPSLVLEQVLATTDARDFALQNVGLGIALMGVALGLTRGALPASSHRAEVKPGLQ
ncbi:MAG: VanZ family protein [Leptolyngbyaceae cyanobacterium bins.349]|nr:VanZ family protein [Leptolyngbyaceae cyanobacterium bins.349]